MNSAILGVVGITLATSLLGRRPNGIAAIAFGVTFGLVLEAVLYTSTLEWSWWVAHGLFGATLGLAGSTLLRRQPA